MKTTADGPTLNETLDDLNRRGFTGHFGITADGVREFGTGMTFRPAALRICECFRFEADSDPGETAIVYAIEAVEAETGVRGTLVDGFGLYANPAISELIRRVTIGQTAESRGRVRAA